jgi:hypothetical protein
MKLPKGKQADIALPAANTAPIAVHVDGEVIGIAVRQGESFLFFSATARTDAFDRVLFQNPAAIREAAKRDLSSRGLGSAKEL